jgi:ubiquinone biosynthesis monooxygenase Coq7
MKLSTTDHCCLIIDRGLRALFGQVTTTQRLSPAHYIKENELSAAERKHSAALMRVNHAGEVCAQALYEGQAIATRNSELKAQMQSSALEENDHLDWCKTRIKELGSHTSFLNPLWYAGSLAIGITAGLAGDCWSLGFLAETEHQVTAHLHRHLNHLTDQDRKSLAILTQMALDEEQHEQKARVMGAADLPVAIKKLMRILSKIMTSTSFII